MEIKFLQQQFKHSDERVLSIRPSIIQPLNPSMRLPSEVVLVMGLKVPCRAELMSWDRVGGLAMAAEGALAGEVMGYRITVPLGLM